MRFGNVGILSHKPLHAMFAEARCQTVHQTGDLPAAVFIIVKADGNGLAFLGEGGFQPDHIKTKAGIQWICQGIQPLVQEAQHHGRIAQRRAGSHHDPFHLAIGAEEKGFELAQALAVTLQHSA